MNNSLQVFSKDNFTVRAIQDENGKVWFVARDVMQALEYSEASTPAQVMQSVPDTWKGIKRIDSTSDKPTARPYQDVLCLSEQGLYFFLGRSDKPKAQPYQIWIADDVVPSIVKTGEYSVNHGKKANYRDELEGVAFIFESAGIKGNQLTLALDNVHKSRNGYSALQAGGIELVAPEQKQILNPTEIGRYFNISGQRVNKILAGAGYQHKINGKWEPLKDGECYAVMLDTGKQHSNGTPVRQLKWHTDILNVVKNLLAASA